MKNVRKTVDKILNVCILVLFIAMFGVTTLNVIMRYVFNSPLSFAVEFGRYTFAGMVYLGSIYVMRDDGHIGLDIVVDALPQPLRTIVKKFSRVLVLAYLAVFFCMSPHGYGELDQPFQHHASAHVCCVSGHGHWQCRYVH